MMTVQEKIMTLEEFMEKERVSQAERLSRFEVFAKEFLELNNMVGQSEEHWIWFYGEWQIHRE